MLLQQGHSWVGSQPVRTSQDPVTWRNINRTVQYARQDLHFKHHRHCLVSQEVPHGPSIGEITGVFWHFCTNLLFDMTVTGERLRGRSNLSVSLDVSGYKPVIGECVLASTLFHPIVEAVDTLSWMVCPPQVWASCGSVAASPWASCRRSSCVRAALRPSPTTTSANTCPVTSTSSTIQ